jgi:uncharacterized protein YbjT (DUF2867 family)
MSNEHLDVIIAEAAAIALTTEGHAGQTYNLVGPQILTGEMTAEIWSRALGKKVAYGGSDLDAWEQQSRQFLPPWLVFDLKLMFAFFQTNGLAATAPDIERQTALIGHPPRTLESFAKETAKMWSAPA